MRGPRGNGEPEAGPPSTAADHVAEVRLRKQEKVVDLGIPGVEGATEIGRGGHGVVYRARQSEFKRTVAVKVLSSVADDVVRGRFRREVEAMGMLSGHPHIVSLHSAGFTDAGQPFLVMDYEPQGSLDAHLRATGPMPWQDAVAVGVRIAGALEVAHRARILHRDVKPENVLLSGYGEPKLADFGVARVEGVGLTRTGAVQMTVAHTPPEVIDGCAPTVAADVYSLSSTIFTVISGRPPYFTGADDGFFSVVARIGRDPVPDLRPSGVPDPVCRVLERALSKQPEERQGSALEFGEDLQAAQRRCGLAETPLAVSPEDVSAAQSEIVLPGSAIAWESSLTGWLPPEARSTGDRVVGSVRSRRRTVLRVALVGALGAGVAASLAAVVHHSGGVDAGHAPPSLHNALLTSADVPKAFAPLTLPADSIHQRLLPECTVAEPPALDQAGTQYRTTAIDYINSLAAHLRSGGAQALMTTLRACPGTSAAPPLGDEAVRLSIKGGRADVIFIREGDYVAYVSLLYHPGGAKPDHALTDQLARVAAQRLGRVRATSTNPPR